MYTLTANRHELWSKLMKLTYIVYMACVSEVKKQELNYMKTHKNCMY